MAGPSDTTHSRQRHASSDQGISHKVGEDIKVTFTNRQLAHGDNGVKGQHVDSTPKWSGQRSSRGIVQGSYRKGQTRDVVFETPAGRAPSTRTAVQLHFSPDSGFSPSEDERQELRKATTKPQLSSWTGIDPAHEESSTSLKEYMDTQSPDTEELRREQQMRGNISTDISNPDSNVNRPKQLSAEAENTSMESTTAVKRSEEQLGNLNPVVDMSSICSDTTHQVKESFPKDLSMRSSHEGQVGAAKNEVCDMGIEENSGRTNRRQKRPLSEVEMSPLLNKPQRACIKLLESGSHTGLTSEIKSLSLKLFVASGDDGDDGCIGEASVGPCAGEAPTDSSENIGQNGKATIQDNSPSLKTGDISNVSMSEGLCAIEQSSFTRDSETMSLASVASTHERLLEDSSDLEHVQLNISGSSMVMEKTAQERQNPDRMSTAGDSLAEGTATELESSVTQELDVSNTSASIFDLNDSNEPEVDRTGQVKGKRSSGKKNVSFDLDASMEDKSQGSNSKTSVDQSGNSEGSHATEMEETGQSGARLCHDWMTKDGPGIQSDCSVMSCDPQERTTLSDMTNISPASSTDGPLTLHLKPVSNAPRFHTLSVLLS